MTNVFRLAVGIGKELSKLTYTPRPKIIICFQNTTGVVVAAYAVTKKSGKNVVHIQQRLSMQ